MTGETPAPAEQNQNPAEYARRLHGDLTTLLEAQGTYVTADAHTVQLAMPGTIFTITDFNSDELAGYPAIDTGHDIHEQQQAFRRQALQDGTAIIDVRITTGERQTDPSDLSSAIVLQPANAVNNSLITTILELAHVDPNSTEHVVLGRDRSGSYNTVAEPGQYRFLTDLSQALAEGQVVAAGEAHPDDAPQQERLRAANFAKQLHLELSGALPFDSFDGARHSTTLQTESGRTVTIHDDFWQNLKGRGFSTDKQQGLWARREDLLEHTSIISISSPNPDTTQPVDQYLVFIPAELNPGSVLGAQMYPIDRDGNPQKPAGEPVDMDSKDYVIWHSAKGHILDPASESLLLDIARTLEVTVPEQS